MDNPTSKVLRLTLLQIDTSDRDARKIIANLEESSKKNGPDRLLVEANLSRSRSLERVVFNSSTSGCYPESAGANPVPHPSLRQQK